MSRKLHAATTPAHPDHPEPAERLAGFVLAAGWHERDFTPPAPEEFFEHPPHEEEGPRYFPPLICEDNLRSQL